LKPSELTPFTSLKIGEIILEAGVPAGVVNIVTGAGATVGQALAEHPDVDFVSFTGGLVTGRKVSRAAADRVARVALELGGKNPSIVFADAPSASLDYALNAAFFHAGQVCSAGSRLLLQEEIHDEFLSALAKRAERIKVGNGFHPETEMGPLISAEHRAKVESYIDLARQEGAKVLVGGERPRGEEYAGGFFLNPTIITGVTHDMRIAREEIFGPVIT